MNKTGIYAIKILLSIFILVITLYIGIFAVLLLFFEGINMVLCFLALAVLPSLFLPLVWLKKRKKIIIIWFAVFLIYIICVCVNIGIIKYEKSITVNTSPNITLSEYLPFNENSKIVKMRSRTLRLKDDLPIIDGAAALFPVYSAFVNAVYPDTTTLYDDHFKYNNTPDGYKLLSEKLTDIFIGVYPSEEQENDAKLKGTNYIYTPIGLEAFVFFTHKDNPVDNLTTEQIKGIYSGKITNWKEVGGKNEKIEAFQRNEGSGSQSMLKRFMGETPLMKAPANKVNDLMAGIVEQVANYKSRTNSIGFSFRFYVEEIIKNPDIKVLSIDGIAPTKENIKNSKYPVITPIYAVTYEGNNNENVTKLLNWILSDEGQYIIDKTGYTGCVTDFIQEVD